MNKEKLVHYLAQLDQEFCYNYNYIQNVLHVVHQRILTSGFLSVAADVDELLKRKMLKSSSTYIDIRIN